MAVPGSPSHSQHQQHNDDEEDSQNEDPKPIQSQSSPRQSSHSETLDRPKSQQSPLHDQEVQNSQKLDKEEDTMLTHDVNDHQSQQKEDHQSGTIQVILPEPIILPDDSKNSSPSPAPPLASPINPQRRLNKRKKGASRRPNKRKKVQNLIDNLNPIPFTPTKTLDFAKHEEILNRLGLLDFSKIEFDRSIRTDLVAQLIVNYDSKKRCSYVDDIRMKLNRIDLARALKLPNPKPEKGSSSTVEEVDLDSEVFSDEAIEFIESFVSNWMLLHDDSWVMPPDIMNWIRFIKDGHPEKMDPARLIWHMVEKELNQGDKLVDCYYASHLQYLIRSQRPELFLEEDEGEETVKAEEEKEDIRKEEDKEDKEDKEEIEDTEEKHLIVKEQNIELTLGSDVKEVVDEEVKQEDEVMVDAGKCKEVAAEVVVEEVVEEVEEQGNWLSDGKNEIGNHFLQRCNSDLNTYEEVKVEELEDEHEHEDEEIQQVDDDDEEDEEEEEEEGGERADADVDEGFDMEANDDSLDRDGMTDNFLQGVEASHNPFGMDLFGSRENSFMSHGGPSSFFNNGKRVMETEEDINHPDPNHKRLKSDEMWTQTQKPSDFGTCMDQIQQWMEKAKMVHESKEQAFQNSQYNHQLEINHLQERQNYMEMLIKSKDEELAKKHNEVFRLEREIYLMGDLVVGYRKALNDTRLKFSEYRKRYALHEEPLYKDAGPGGLVLSTRELERQRVKQEEDRVKIGKMVKSVEEEWVCKLEMHHDRVLKMGDKLVSIESDVKDLKGMCVERKVSKGEPEEKRELVDEGELLGEAEVHEKEAEEQGLDVEREADKKIPDEVVEDDANVDSVLPDADESEEKEGGDD